MPPDQRSVSLLSRSEEHKALVFLYFLDRLLLLCRLWIRCCVIPALDIGEAALQNGTIVVFNAGFDYSKTAVLQQALQLDVVNISLTAFLGEAISMSMAGTRKATAIRRT